MLYSLHLYVTIRHATPSHNWIHSIMIDNKPLCYTQDTLSYGINLLVIKIYARNVPDGLEIYSKIIDVSHYAEQLTFD